MDMGALHRTAGRFQAARAPSHLVTFEHRRPSLPTTPLTSARDLVIPVYTQHVPQPVTMASSAMISKPLVAKPASAPRAARRSVAVRAAGAPAMVPDMNKRNLMNLALVGAAALPVGGLALGYASFFIPPRLVILLA